MVISIILTIFTAHNHLNCIALLNFGLNWQIFFQIIFKSHPAALYLALSLVIADVGFSQKNRLDWKLSSFQDSETGRYGKDFG